MANCQKLRKVKIDSQTRYNLLLILKVDHRGKDLDKWTLIPTIRNIKCEEMD